jgi:hypothetical protein
MKIHNIINVVTNFSFLFPLLVSFRNYNNYRLPYKYLFGFVIVELLVEVFKTYHSWGSISVWYVFDLNLYTFGETFFLAMVYHSLLKEPWKKWIRISLATLLLFFLADLIWIEGPFALNSIALNLECTLLLIFSAKLYHTLIVDVPTKSLLKMPEFWFNNAIFLYFSMTFFVFPFGNELLNNPDGHFNGFHLWDINDIVNIFFNVFFAISLWLAKENREWTPASS